MSNHRQHRRRTPAFDFPVLDSLTREQLGRLGDVSEGGLLVYGARRLPAEQPYRLAILGRDPAGHPKEYHVDAHAIWSGPDRSPGLYSTGFRLDPLTRPEAANTLAALMELFTIDPRDDDFDDDD